MNKNIKMDTRKFNAILAGLLLISILIPAASAVEISAIRDIPSSANAGDTITVSLAVTLASDATITGAIIKDFVPSGWNVTSSNPTTNSFNFATGEAKWVLYGASLATQTITYNVKIPNTETTGSKTFSGQVLYTTTQQNTDDITGDTSISVTGVTPIATISAIRDIPSSANAGDTITVSLAVTLASDATITGAIIKDFVPSGWNVTSSNPTANSFDATTGEVKWVLYGTSLKSQTITYNVKIPAKEKTSTKTFSGNVLYTEDEIEKTDDVAGDTTISVTGAPAPITVEREVPVLKAGDTAEISLVVTISPTTTISGVIIKDLVPSGWNVTSSNPTANSFDLATGEIKWVLYGALFESQTITYTVSVPETATGDETFDGQVLYNDEEGIPVTDVTGGDTESASEVAKRRLHYFVVNITGDIATQPITVTVTDKDTGKVISGVGIDVYLNNKKVVYGKTDDKGIFTFTPTEAGKYEITVEKSRYRDASKTITVITGAVTTTTTIMATTTTLKATTTTVGVTTTTMQPTTTTVKPTTTTVKATTTTLITTTTLPKPPVPGIPTWLIAVIVIIIIAVVVYLVSARGKGGKPKAKETKTEEKTE